jgi:periplasmic protein TonB
MHEFSFDPLDEAIVALLAGRQPVPARDPDLRELIHISSALRYLPRPEFRARLRADLLAAAEMTGLDRRTSALVLNGRRQPRPQGTSDTVIPPLFRPGAGGLPVRGAHLAVSFGLHVVALALVAASGWWMVEHRALVSMKVAELVPGGETYLQPPSRGEARGGGGGGNHDRRNASPGSAPRLLSEQLTPPAVIVRKEDPKLPAEPAVVGPPNLELPQSAQVGDPMAAILAPPSDGTGTGGGIGSGEGGGVGMGHGPGVGDGRGGGMGGGVYRVGGGVSAPRPVYDPDPEYSEQARKAKYQGSVMLWAVIGPDGRPRELRVMRSLGMGLDEKALEAVRKWRFAPAMKDGQAVAVQIHIEVAFRLY